VDIIDAYAKCTYDKVLEIGCGTGMLSKMIVEDFGIQNLYVNDIVPEMEEVVVNLLKTMELGSLTFLAGDAETIDLPSDCDLVVSASAFQWFENLEPIFEKIEKSLSDKGFFIYNSFGAENFKEIREITGGGLEYRSYDMMKDSLSKSFKIKHSEDVVKRLYFDTPKDVLKHLSLTGVNATRLKKTWTKATLQDFEEKYKARYSDEKGVYITYNPVYFVCHK
jgi:malonyl-ACP O-methyltransferase BioC